MKLLKKNIMGSEVRANPILLETVNEYTTHELKARNDLIFLADPDRGFVILRY